jgi:hypothetical protein
MKIALIFLTGYFGLSLLLRVVRLFTMPRHELFNTPAQNVGAIFEYGLLAAGCLIASVCG